MTSQEESVAAENAAIQRPMTPIEKARLGRLLEGRSKPWIEYRCGATGARSHLIASVHPVGNIPPMLATNDAVPLAGFAVAVWLHRGTGHPTRRAPGWVPEIPIGERVLLPDRVYIVDFDEPHDSAPESFWVVCPHQFDEITMSRLVVDLNTARGQITDRMSLPVRRFMLEQ